MASASWRNDCRLIIYETLIVSLTVMMIDHPVPVSSSDYSAFRKCCSPGSVLTLKDGTYACKSPRENGTEFFDRGLGSGGLPVCQNGGKLRTTSLADLKSNDSIRGDFCTDLFSRVEDNRELVPVLVICDDSIRSWETRGIPQLIKIRRCCPQGQVFVQKNRACLTVDHNEQEIFSTQSLLRDLGAYDFIQVTRGPPECDLAIFDYEVNASDVSIVGGKLQVQLSNSHDLADLILDEETGCLDSGSAPGLLVVRTCRGIDFCRTNSCVRKCCREDEAYVNAICEKLPAHLTASRWHSEVWNLSKNTGDEVQGGVLNTTEYGIIFGKPCLYSMWPALLNQDHWHIVAEGKVYVPNYTTYEYDHHCIEMFYGHSAIPDGFHSFICFDKPSTTVEKEKVTKDIRNWVTASLALISCAFLLMTLIVYMCLPSLRNLQGKTLMCYVASLLMGFVCLALVTVASPKEKLDDPDDPDAESRAGVLCAIWGYAMLFSFFSAFSWLNVMCFDMWWKFGSLTRSRKPNPNGKNHSRRFLSYCLYAYGLPLAVLIFAVSVDHHQFLPRPFRPDIGNNTCWFARGPKLYGQLVYFIVPLTIQMLVNLVSFIVTVRRCNLIKSELQGRSEVDRSDPRSRRFDANKTRLILNLKLFVFMGISWVMEMVSYFCTVYASDSKFTKKIFYATDVLNLLQGLLIFMLFVMKRKVIFGLRNRFTTGSSQRSSIAGIHDPYRVRKSPSNSTMLSTFQGNSSP